MAHDRRRTQVLIAAVKTVPSVIFLTIAAAILHIFVAGLRGRPSRWTGPALGLALGESAIFALNRFRCPLTEVVRDLTGESVRVTDIFLPRWVADRIPLIFTPPLVIGLLGLARGRWRYQLPHRWSRNAAPNGGVIREEGGTPSERAEYCSANR